MVLSIIDSGEGIPEEVQARIFTPLVTTKAKGMGMSLAIFKRIVEAHDGKITIQSEKGTGTKVKIALPHGKRSGFGFRLDAHLILITNAQGLYSVFEHFRVCRVIC